MSEYEEPSDPAVAALKVCTMCGAAISHREWQALPFLGRQELDDEFDAELKTHSCGTTLAVPIAKDLP